MNILIVGARGFLGRHLARALQARGHHVRHGGRARPPASSQDWVPADFSQDTQVRDWVPRLDKVDAVANTAGIFRERGRQRFGDVHISGPAALFGACALLHVPRALHVSAVGADDQAASPYHLSKHEGDKAVRVIHQPTAIVQPSLVYGPDGASSRLFLALACLPLIPVPAGTQWVQPIHVDDAAQAMARLLDTPGHEAQRISLVGPEPIAWRDYLAALRQGLGLGPARFLPVPHALVALGARPASLLPGALIDMHSWRMLQRGNTADASGVTRLLGQAPRPPQAFVRPDEQAALRTRARLDTLLPMLRALLAAVWLVTAVVSLGIYPVADSLALLARVGLEGPLAPVMLAGAAGTDFALGMATLLWPRRRLWWAQIALIGFYTAVISLFLPEFWAHPYGPVLKNLPIIGTLIVLLAFEERP